MSSIVVIGAMGTIGRPLVAELQRRGHSVFKADLVHSGDDESLRCNIGEYRQVEKLFRLKKFEFAYNLAAEFGRKNGEDYFEQLWETNVVGLKNLLTIQEKEGFKLIHFSSSEIYGEIETPDGLLRESLSEKSALHQNNDYAISKWVNELQIRNSIAVRGTESLIVRLFNAYGPGEFYTPYRSVVSQFIYKALRDLPYEVYLNYHRVFMYVDDLIPTLANIVDYFRPGEVYNIGGEEYVDVKTVSDMILSLLGKGDEKVRYLDADVHNVKSKRPDISKARRDLKHNPSTPLRVGIPKTIDWYTSIYGKR